ncbi:MAG: hypothetical protein WKF97_13845 [Chitinophagaceae bacterium]
MFGLPDIILILLHNEMTASVNRMNAINEIAASRSNSGFSRVHLRMNGKIDALSV